MRALSFRLIAAALLLAAAPAGFAYDRSEEASAAQIDFGSDSSEWANDGECDDPRFEGPGMTETTLLDSDRFGDATDCNNASGAGQLTLRSEAPPKRPTSNGVQFGTDSSEWANDGECDDPRFKGPGMTTTTLLESDAYGDATDCKTAFDAGLLTLRERE